MRTDEISADPRASAVVSDSRRSNASGDWYSLMSMRISRSADPNRNSARVFAISVFPVPVGPTKRNTPRGREGSVTPALIIAMRSTMQSTASGCSRTRSVKNAFTASSGSGAAASRSASGSPELAASVVSTSLPPNVAAPCSAASAAVAWASRRRFPGCATLGRNCCASSSASARVSSSASTPSASCSSACLATATVSGSSSGRTRTSSNALLTLARAATSTSAAAGVTSATMAIAPDSMWGRSASSRPCGLRECWPANKVSCSSGRTQITRWPATASTSVFTRPSSSPM